MSICELGALVPQRDSGPTVGSDPGPKSSWHFWWGCLLPDLGVTVSSGALGSQQGCGRDAWHEGP